MTSRPELELSHPIGSHLPIAADTATLCALVLIGPQLFGGAFPWSVFVIVGLSLVALATALWVHRSSPPPTIDSLFVMMGAAWLWTCVQAVPLPAGIARGLGLASVTNAERLQGLAWAGQIPLTISSDPGSTQLQVLVGVAILAAFLAARMGGPSGLRPIAIATVFSALLLGIEGIAHRAAGADAVFGVYAPRFVKPQLLTPLMNGNHLGGLALMGALIAAGLAAQKRDGRSRLAWAIGSGICASIVALTFSRGAIGSLLFGVILFAAWLVRGARSERRSATIPAGVVGAATVGVLTFASLEPILSRFETQGFDKLAVAGRGLRLLHGSAWWLGIGRGAFSSAFVAEEGSLARYTHPENILVQWTTEWGVPVAFALLLVLALALWKRLRAAEQPLVAGTCIAILALSVQNLVDFSLEMAGIAAIAAALLGALLPASSESRSTPSLRLSALILVAFTLISGVMGTRSLGYDTQSIVDRLTRAMQSDDEKEFQSTLHRGLALHPGEPAFALLAGTYAGSKGYVDAPRWLGVVMQEAPGWAAPHVVAAQWLLDKGRLDQALLEIRQAEERQPGSATIVSCEALTRFPKIEHLEQAAPRADLRVPYLDRTSACPALSAELRAEIDAAILQSEPTRASAVLREARRLSAQRRSGEAKALLEHAVERHPENVSLWVTIIGAHLRDGEVESSRLALTRARSRGLDSRALTEAQARIEAALGETAKMRATITRLRGQSRGEASLVAASFILEGQLEASLGNIDEALAAYLAADVARSETAALQYAATLALKSGRATQALRIYRTLCAREPGGSACAQEARLSSQPREAPPKRPMP